MIQDSIRRKVVSSASILIMLIAACSASGSTHVVTKTARNETLEGTMPYILKNASGGDTIVFNIPDTSIIQIAGKLRITKDLVLDGRNVATGERIVLKNASLFIGGCKARLSNFIFRELTGTSTERYSPISDSGLGTVVWLDNIEIEGSFFYDNDVYVRPAVLNYQGAEITISRCKIHKWPGGGVSNSLGTITIINSILDGNSSYSDEIGGIYNYSGVVTIYNTTISNNSISVPGYNGGWTGGAGIANFDGVMAVFNCTIKENKTSNHLTWSIDFPSAESWGGGILNYQSPPPNYLPTVFSIFNSTICANEAYAESEDRRVTACPYGGGACFTDDAYITNCTFLNNRIRGAQNFDPKGPEVYLKGIPFFINNLFVTNQRQFTTVYNSNWLKGVGNLTNDTVFEKTDNSEVSWGYSAKDFFGTDSVKLSFNGGQTETAPIARNSKAIGKGIRAGYYFYDTVFTTPNFKMNGTIYKSAYHNGTKWISAETGAPVPEKMEVVYLSTDQRGKPRNDPPCAGAFELTPDDSIPVNVNHVRSIKRDVHGSYMVGNRLFFRSSSEGFAVIQLIDLVGRVVYCQSISVVAGINCATVDVRAKGTVICRVTDGRGGFCSKLILQQQ